MIDYGKQVKVKETLMNNWQKVMEGEREKECGPRVIIVLLTLCPGRMKVRHASLTRQRSATARTHRRHRSVSHTPSTTLYASCATKPTSSPTSLYPWRAAH